MVDVRKALDRFLRHHRIEGHTPKTIRAYSQFVGQFADYLDQEGHSGQIEDLCADDLRGWLDYLQRPVNPPEGEPAGRGNAPKTVQTKAIHVKAFASWLAEDSEYLDRDPFRKVGRPKADNPPKAALTTAQIETLLGVCDRKRVTGARDFAAILLLYSCGVRAEELCGLAPDDIDSDRGLIVIQRGKGGDFRVVPLGVKVERALDKYLSHPVRRQQSMVRLFLTQEGEPLTYDGLKMVFRRLEDRTGIHCNPHKWRHTAARHYLRNGGKVESLRAMLGHATLDMTLHYAKLEGVDLATAHETADPARALKVRV